MDEIHENRELPVKQSTQPLKNDFPGYPVYPAKDDIYNKYQEEKDVNPEDVSKNKALNDTEGVDNEKSGNDISSGSELDVPGSELDDKMEEIGSEDEENNYYSLGGDDHNDLDEA